MQDPTEFQQFVSWGFYSLLTFVAGYFAYSIRNDFRDITDSLHKLTITVAQLNERLVSFEKSLDRLDHRLEAVEKTKGE